MIVTGFQGINRLGDITTLGRGRLRYLSGGIAAALHADLCQIYTDVDGVYTADPREIKGARKLDEITYNEMLELATLGAQVLHNRSVEMAKKYNVKLEVLSSFSGNPGTRIKEVAKGVEKSYISSVAKDKNIARIALLGVPDETGTSFKVFSLLAANNINVDIILQGTIRISIFTVAEGDLERAAGSFEGASGKHRLLFHGDKCRRSQGFRSGSRDDRKPRVAARLFEALYDAGVNINMISTSEIKISVLVDRQDATKAVQAIHDKFFTMLAHRQKLCQKRKVFP